MRRIGHELKDKFRRGAGLDAARPAAAPAPAADEEASAASTASRADSLSQEKMKKLFEQGEGGSPPLLCAP